MRPILGIIVLVAFAGCKKETSEKPKYEVVFNMNGTKEVFTPFYSSIQPNSSIPGNTDFMLVARSGGDKNHFAITIQVTGDFQTGTYTSNNLNYTVIADYFQNVGQPDEQDYTIDHAPLMPACSFVVNITSIDEHQIRGNFTGNYLYDRINDESIVVSDGSFVVKRH